MSRVRISRGRLLAVGVLAVVVVGAVWYINRSEPIPTRPPTGAPHPGSCFAVTPDQARQAMPWPGAVASCTSAHTAEVYETGQVSHDLIDRARTAKGNDAKIADALMYAVARKTCEVSASGYLGVNWHGQQVTLVAVWITPGANGFFGCAVVQVTGPGGTAYVTRAGSLKGAGATGTLAIGCVVRAGDATQFASCTEPHNSEFVGTYQITPDNAPFDAKSLVDAVNAGCTKAILAYLGLPETASRTDLTPGYVGPTNASDWLGSDQTFACYARATGEIRGTLRNLGTRPLPT